tara:strand:- start:488 stop:1177 length:690 start_codon:yes stop_codon:yes gene_type:complete
MKKIFNYTFIFGMIIFLSPSIAFSHSGGLNSSGCHSGSKPYHCHRSQSEMTKSSSGGNRLKCSSGSTSKDCKKSTNSVTSVYQNNTKNELKKTQYVSSADGEAITIFGINFDMNKNDVIDVITERYGCNKIWISEKKCKIDDGGSPVTWYLNDLGQIQSIHFNCVIYNGCTYSRDQVYENISSKYKLFDNEIGNIKTCGFGILGEKICIHDQSLTFSRNKFRQLPISFD